jgi:hypothetical protein
LLNLSSSSSISVGWDAVSIKSFSNFVSAYAQTSASCDRKEIP